MTTVGMGTGQALEILRGFLCECEREYFGVAIMDRRPIVSKATAKALKTAGKIEGENYLIARHCIGKRRQLCSVCLRLIRRRDQRCSRDEKMGLS